MASGAGSAAQSDCEVSVRLSFTTGQPLPEGRGSVWASVRKPSLLLLAVGVAHAATMAPSASRAFDSYVATVEARLGTPSPRPAIEPVNGGSWKVGGGMLHHWRASAIVPGATAEDLLALLRDYDHLARHYAPEVVSSHALANGVAMRFRKHQVVTVVLDAEFETKSGLSAPGRGFSVSRSTHIWQIDNPGSRRERRLPEGDDDGYLWRLNSYWNFVETSEGLLMECEAVSLTRDVPTGLGWLVMPVIRTLPRTSLQFTMMATQNALRRHDDARDN
jgi:hypothetical protein